jgi:hypothetical protein
MMVEGLAVGRGGLERRRKKKKGVGPGIVAVAAEEGKKVRFRSLAERVGRARMLAAEEEGEGETDSGYNSDSGSGSREETERGRELLGGLELR